MNKGAMRYVTIVCISIIAFVAVGWTAPKYARTLTHRLYQEHYVPKTNSGADSVISHMRMAAKAGYNGVNFSGPFSLDKIESWSSKNKAGYERVKAEAKRLKMTLIPPVANALMGTHADPMLSEVVPARGTPFKVANGIARCASDHKVNVVNGNFESFSGNNPTGWQQRNLVGSLARDGANKHGGSSSLRASNMKSGAYIYQDIAVKPYRVYRITAWFKTASLTSIRDVEFVVKGKEDLLDRRWRAFGNRKRWTSFSTNMNWTKCVADFGSQNNSKVNLAFWFAGVGYGTGSGGTIWIDDLVVEEVGLYETIRRDDCPIVVKSTDGSKTYKEGTDYTVDPRCNKFTANDHEYEGHLKIPEGSAIKNGETIKVSWYKHADNYLLFSETNFCIQESFDAMRDDITRIDELFGQNELSFLAHDEWRSAFQSDRCPLFPKARTAGEYMAAVMAKTVTNCRCVNNAKRELILYNDMYDPYHNARTPYHLCGGGTANSWKGLDTSIIILNWSANHLETYRFFMGLDPLRKGKVNRQLMNVQGAGEVGHKISIIKSLEAKGGRGFIGCNWVTWYNRWFHMPLVANAFKAQGWWGTGTIPSPGQAKPNAAKCGTSIDTKANHVSATTAIGLTFLNGSETCQIQYELPYHSRVDLRMVDAQGRMVRKLVGKEQTKGIHRVNVSAQKIPAGVYFFDLRINGEMEKRARHVVM